MTMMNDNWTLIKDEKPKAGESVLFQAERDGHMYIGYVTAYGGIKCITVRNSTVTGMKPIAWMELPEKYRKT